MRGPYVNGPYAWGNGPYKLEQPIAPCEIGKPVFMQGPYVNGPYAWGNGPYKLERGSCQPAGPVYMEGPYVNGAYACGNGPYDCIEPCPPPIIIPPAKCEQKCERKCEQKCDQKCSKQNPIDQEETLCPENNLE
jgi:hypothetical protein